MFVQKEKKRKKQVNKRAHLTTLHATGLQYVKHFALSNASRPAAYIDFGSLVLGWEDDHLHTNTYTKKCIAHVQALCDHRLALNPSVLIFSMATVCLVQTGVVSRLCSAVNPALNSISMLSSQTCDNAHTHQGVVVCFI